MITLNQKNQAVIAGTDIHVEKILHLLKHYSTAYVLYEFPELRQGDITDCLDYAIRCLPKVSPPLSFPERWEITGE